jgi:hypothetical protein
MQCFATESVDETNLRFFDRNLHVIKSPPPTPRAMEVRKRGALAQTSRGVFGVNKTGAERIGKYV